MPYMYIIKSANSRYAFDGNQRDALKSAREHSFYSPGFPVYLIRWDVVHGSQTLYRIINGKAHKLSREEQKTYYD